VPGGVSMAQFALQFALSEARIDTILIGISERSHLDEALTAYRQGPLEARPCTRSISGFAISTRWQ